MYKETSFKHALISFTCMYIQSIELFINAHESLEVIISNLIQSF